MPSIKRIQFSADIAAQVPKVFELVRDRKHRLTIESVAEICREERAVNVASFLGALESWAKSRSDVVGLALVGSHARGAQRPDSDVDLVILCTDPAKMLGGSWPSDFGEVGSSAVEDYGALKSRRVSYRGLEVEFGIAAPGWARLPLDPGTRSVLAGGVQVLYDPEGFFRVAIDAAIASPANAASAGGAMIHRRQSDSA